VPSPLCFVLMPFGAKTDAGGMPIDFDVVYRELIAPAIRAAGLEPLRADEEVAGGIIHKPMFERLILCEYAVADLTTASANVFYELGLRHAVRPWSTVALFAEGGRLPFDVAPLRAMPYPLTPAGTPADLDETRSHLVKRLREARAAAADQPPADSPIYQLVDGYPNQITRERTDVFREQVRYSAEQKQRLADARSKDESAVAAVEDGLGPLSDVEAGVVIDLFLTYRAVSAWERMVALARKMPGPLAQTVLVQEQLGLALNRMGRGEEAEQILVALIARRGPSSETCGILGRVYKDRWERARDKGDVFTAKGLLTRAIDSYRRGFEADWRDAYPGVNAVTLMEVVDPPDPARLQILPVVAYAVERRIATGKSDYWDYATRLELAVLAKDEARASAALADALAAVRAAWEAQTTARNLRIIREARQRRGEILAWAQVLEDALATRAG
jgi:MAP3K TRAFs-binding domain